MKHQDCDVLERGGSHEDGKKPGDHPDAGPKFFVCIELKTYPWPDNTITTEEIIETGGWDPDQGVIEVDREQNERTLKPGEVVEIKPGHGFGKKVCFKRG